MVSLTNIVSLTARFKVLSLFAFMIVSLTACQAQKPRPEYSRTSEEVVVIPTTPTTAQQQYRAPEPAVKNNVGSWTPSASLASNGSHPDAQDQGVQQESQPSPPKIKSISKSNLAKSFGTVAGTSEWMARNRGIEQYTADMAKSDGLTMDGNGLITVSRRADVLKELPEFIQNYGDRDLAGLIMKKYRVDNTVRQRDCLNADSFKGNRDTWRPDYKTPQVVFFQDLCGFLYGGATDNPIQREIYMPALIKLNLLILDPANQ
ncbi:MAG: hypothetical protein SGJ02_09995 [bacterium]|nr:hypothetical protein [bacterium]